MTNDYTIRRALIEELSVELRKDPQTKLVPEVEICMGYARIDVMLVNGILHGFEIKSDKDTLDRLSHQAGLYEQVFEKITLVCGERHYETAEREIAPWWGIWVAQNKGETIYLKKVRPAKYNPVIDPYSVVQLLWKEEVLSELQKRGLDRGVRSKPRNILWEKLAESLSIDELCLAVKRCIKNRKDWRIAEQQG